MADEEMPSDSLTDEQKMVVELQLERAVAKGKEQIRSLVCCQIEGVMSINPESTPQSLSATLKVPVRTIRRYLREMTKSGKIKRENSIWVVNAA